ncbi:MAG TPA: polysaccharide deacetylase family protein [Burkholderiales bacterium]|jgi:peptidoglycan/xylan/chitin deacetylase (PgdA/CDA1 family)|nr:polysaccharide deacetylase family protein [Burkholderiales bacterium]
MRTILFALLFAACGLACAESRPRELHQVLDLPDGARVAALTLDACGGAFDAELVDFLVEHRIPATIFATRRWLRRNPQALAKLVGNADLFDIENHGANHVPAFIGRDTLVYGIAGELDVAHLKREVSQGASAVAKATGAPPRWYRGATAEYDDESLRVIEQMGYKVAGFSVNADAGASLPKARIVARLKKVKNGDIIIAHVNRPESDTAEGLAAGLALLQARGFRFVKLGEFPLRPLRPRLTP